MKKHIAKLSILTLCAAAIVAMPTLSLAQDTTNTPAAETGKKKAGTTFKGNIKSVDATANTLTVGDLTLQITADTKITKDGQEATLSDLKAGDAVHGAYQKNDDGKLEAVMIRDGKGGKKKKEAAPAPAAQ